MNAAGEGRRTSFAQPQTGFTESRVNATSGVGSSQVCRFTARASAPLAAGTWVITLVTPFGSLGRCTVTLNPGANYASFGQGATSCVESRFGFQYP